MKKLENPRVFPSTYIPNEGYYKPGTSLRDYFAAKAKDDFNSFELATQEAIVGRTPPERKTGEYIIGTDYGNIEYAKWLSEGIAKWRFMQADAMLTERVKNQEL